MIPGKFHVEWFNTDLENWFWKVRKKIQIFKKVGKNSDQMAEDKSVF
jgi:hypothetical protein